MNLIDSINECIIAEYDGPNGILTLHCVHDLLFWRCGFIFVKSKIDTLESFAYEVSFPRYE